MPVITYLNGQSFGSQFNGGVVDGCIGVLFTDSLLNIYYGWIRMDVMHSQLKVVIKDYAYNPFGDEVLVCDTSSVCNMATSMVLNVSSVDETFLGANDGSATASVIGGYPPYSYLWNSNSNSAFIDSLSPQTYYISVTDSMGCVVSDSVVIMSGSARFFDVDENNVSIYPNPTRSDLFIITLSQIQAGYLYGLNGKLLNVFNSDRIDMSFYQSGIYLLKIYTNEGVCLFRVIKINHFSFRYLMKQKKLLVIGWDAADWKVINPLIQDGKMPALKKLMERGVFGNLKNLRSPLISYVMDQYGNRS